MDDDLKQELYLIADKMRGMATVGGYYAYNPYEVERAECITPTDLARKSYFQIRVWLKTVN